MKVIKDFLKVVKSIERVIAVLMFFVLMTSLLYSAGIPPFINYQGRIFTPVGTTNPVADGYYTFEFRIYDIPTGGVELWYRQISAVATNRGFFNVELGPLDILDFTKEYWLDIKFNGEQMTPRQKLLAAPYAARAQFVNEINPTTTFYGPISITGNVLPPIALFGVTNTGGTAIYGVATNGEQVAGVAGTNYSPSSITAGVYGFGLNGLGVYGVSSGTAQVGVRGENIFGYGVSGKGLTGVAGEAMDANSIGVLAKNYYGGRALEVEGSAYINCGTGGVGVKVKNYGKAIEAESNMSGEKVITGIHYGTSGGEIGVYGGVTGSANGTGVVGEAVTGVYGRNIFAPGAGLLGESMVSNGIGVKGKGYDPYIIGILAENISTFSGSYSGAALYVSGTVKTSKILFSDNGSYTTTWNVNAGNQLNYGPAGAIRTVAPLNNISQIIVTTPVVTSTSVVMVTFVTSQTIQNHSIRISGGGSFIIQLQPSVNFSSGEGFNYLIIN